MMSEALRQRPRHRLDISRQIKPCYATKRDRQLNATQKRIGSKVPRSSPHRERLRQTTKSNCGEFCIEDISKDEHQLACLRPSIKPSMDDEWLKTYGKRAEIPLHVLNNRVIESWRRHAGAASASLSDLDLLFSDKPNHSNIAHNLNQFIIGHEATLDRFTQASPGQLLLVYPSDPLPVADIAWIDHRIWVDGFATSLTIPQQPEGLVRLARLQPSLRIQDLTAVTAQRKDLIYRRLIYISDPDGAAVLALAREASFSMVNALYALLHGYLTVRPISRCQVLRSPITYEGPLVLMFQLSFFTLSREIKEDTRRLGKRPLRHNIPLSFLSLLGGDESAPNKSCFMCQGVTSFAITIYDKRLWDGICLNDEWFMEYSRMAESPDLERPLQRPSFNCPDGLRSVPMNTTDPILNQEASDTYADPRVYFLKSLENMLEDTANYYQELFEEFEGPIETYRNIFLPHASPTTGVRCQTAIPTPSSKAALLNAQRLLQRIDESVSQQIKVVKTFFTNDLCLDHSTFTMWSPLFAGLNKDVQQGKARNICAYIVQKVDRLDAVQASIRELRNHCDDINLEHDRLANGDVDLNRHYASRAIGITFPQFALAAFALPIGLYNVPPETSRLPTSFLGFLGVLFLLPTILLSAASIFIFPNVSTALLVKLRQWRVR